MGCDVHMYVEVKDSDDKWVPYDGEWDNPEYDPNGSDWQKQEKPKLCQYGWPYRWEFQEDPNYPEPPIYEAFDPGRNYDLFSMLADVRNGYGFAGCPTGEYIQPICGPKGVPDDASPEYLQIVERWDGDGHSHSWLTLRELEAYDWGGQTKEHTGIVDLLGYISWKKLGAPHMSYGDISGHDVVKLSHEAMDLLVAQFEANELEIDEKKTNPFTGIVLKDGTHPVTRVNWTTTYADSAKYWCEVMMPLLRSFAPDGDPDRVRIVFFFDN